MLQNRASGRFHRLTPAAYQLVGRLDGQSSLQQLLAHGVDNCPTEETITEEEVVSLVKQLSLSDLLQLDQNLPHDFYRRRVAAFQRINGWRRLLNPLAIKIPLFDPDRFLQRTLGFGRLMFSPVGLVIWMAVVFYAAGLAAMHWQALTGNLVDRVLSADNLFVMFVVFPVIKVLHELGHGYAARRWGGEVHEIGIMFLVFMPIPYVDASSATAFRQRFRRMMVAAAGMLVEVFLAALAVMVWVSVEPGFARAVAFNVIFLAGVSTLLFNGNPLLRYDGYYMLSDLLEMPNLGPRANQYIGYLIQRYLFGADLAESDHSRSEKTWLVVYGLLSFCYRMFVWVAIILFVATRFFFFGVLLAVWGAVLMIVRPLYRVIKHLFVARILEPVRRRAFTVSGGFFLGLLLVLFVIPVPYAKVVEGVVWLPEGALVRAQASGFVTRVLPEVGEQVATNSVLIELNDPIAVSEVALLQAQQEELEAQYGALQVSDRVKAGVVAERIALARSRLERAQRNLDSMTVRSGGSGSFYPVLMGDLIGSYVHKGQVLGYVLGQYQPTIRAVVNQQDYLLVRDWMTAIDALFVEDSSGSMALDLIQEVPSASDELPSRALSQAGGGEHYLDPADTSGGKALQSYFQFEMSARGTLPTARSGGRVHVRFDLGSQPLFWRIHREFRQLFLSRFSI